MKKVVIALCCTLGFYTSAFSQDAKPILKAASVDAVVSSLQTLSTTKAIEKVYLHFDRSVYSAGDTMYFKAYLTLGERHELSKLNGLLHVELINSNDSLLRTITLQTNNGLAWGDFALPGSLPKGKYYVKAYTKWMLSASDPVVFYKQLTVNSTVPAQPKFSTMTTRSTNKFDTQFFAEGGSFVNSIPVKLAFKAIDRNGMGTDVKGTVVDNLNAEVTKFQTKHLGMGVFYVTPEAGKTYSANLTYPDGTKTTVSLPVADEKGITLLVKNEDPDKLMIEINANKPYYLSNKNKEISLLIYSKGAISMVNTVLDNQVLDLNLPKKNFQTGIVQISLFSKEGEPLNERLAFIQNNDLLNLQTSTGKTVYAARDKVHITVNAKNKDDKPIKGFFSVSVIDAEKVPVNENDETTILTNLLLTSDMRGLIEQPNYYFARVTNDTRADLDLLMLTQGYRRFVWKQLLSADANTAAVYPVERGINMSGMVQTKDGKPVANGSVTLMPDNGSTITNQTTDDKGRFTFTDLAFADNSKFLIQAKTNNGRSNVRISLDKEAPNVVIADGEHDFTANNLEKVNNTSQNKAIYMADASGKLLKEVIVKDKFLDPEHGTITQFSDQTGISHSLEGHLPGVALTGGVPYLRDRIGITGAGPMMVIVDGAQMNGSIDNLSVSDVESVKMLKNNDAAIYGLQGSNGVLLITTKKDKSVTLNKSISDGLLSFNAKGFYKARTFYSPTYGGSALQSNKPDERKTIYWNPDITTDTDGNASFDVFNADGKGVYRLVVEGIDDSGNLGRSVYTYNVE